MLDISSTEINQVITELENSYYCDGVAKMLSFLYDIRDKNRHIASIGIRDNFYKKTKESQ